MPIMLVKVEPRCVTVNDGEQQAEFLVRPVDYETYTKALLSLRSSPHGCGACPPSQPNGTILRCRVCDSIRWSFFMEQIRPKVLVDWRAVLDEQGQPIPLSISLALGGLSDRV